MKLFYVLEFAKPCFFSGRWGGGGGLTSQTASDAHSFKVNVMASDPPPLANVTLDPP